MFLSWSRVELKRGHWRLCEGLESRCDIDDLSGTTRRSWWSWLASHCCCAIVLAWRRLGTLKTGVIAHHARIDQTESCHRPAIRDDVERIQWRLVGLRDEHLDLLVTVSSYVESMRLTTYLLHGILLLFAGGFAIPDGFNKIADLSSICHCGRSLQVPHLILYLRLRSSDQS